MSARLRGIIIRIPRRPPSTATSITRDSSKSNPRIKIAGIVTPIPNAIDSPADPAVWTMLFSRIVASRNPNFENTRKRVMEITATGIEALTVSPTLRTRYNEDAPKMMPRTVPIINGKMVSSRIRTPAGIYGRKVARYGLSGLKPTRSGYSFAGMLSLDIRFDLQQFLKNGECAGVRKRRYFTRPTRAG